MPAGRYQPPRAPTPRAQWTPATSVTAQAAEACSLPQRVLPVHVPRFGVIDVSLSLAGSTVVKITPNFAACQAAAAAAAAAEAGVADGEAQQLGGDGNADAAAVAAAAVAALEQGLADGTVTLDAHLIF